MRTTNDEQQQIKATVPVQTIQLQDLKHDLQFTSTKTPLVSSIWVADASNSDSGVLQLKTLHPKLILTLLC